VRVECPHLSDIPGFNVDSKTYVSSRHDKPPIDQVEFKPEISHFTENGIIFHDGTACNVDAVLLATGYELRKPFLDAGHALLTEPSVTSNSSSNRNLTTNLHYIFPLHQTALLISHKAYSPHILSGIPTFYLPAKSALIDLRHMNTAIDSGDMIRTLLDIDYSTARQAIIKTNSLIF
jgi:hypothetical protein